MSWPLLEHRPVSKRTVEQVTGAGQFVRTDEIHDLGVHISDTLDSVFHLNLQAVHQGTVAEERFVLELYPQGEEIHAPLVSLDDDAEVGPHLGERRQSLLNLARENDEA